MPHQEMVVEKIFPKAVAVLKNIEITRDAMKFLMNRDFKQNLGNMTSVNTYLLDEPELTDLRAFVVNCLEAYFNYVYAPHDYVKIRLTQSWINLNKTGHFHHLHYHQNSFISGCLYLNANKEEDQINFYKSEEPTIYVHPRDRNEYTSESWNVPVETGMMVIFPSSLRHEVKENKTPKDRISLAFNSFLEGVIGESGGSTELKVSVNYR